MRANEQGLVYYFRVLTRAHNFNYGNFLPQNYGRWQKDG